VARSLGRWEEPSDTDLVLDAMTPMAENVAHLAGVVGMDAG
jgi:hypothetical protein